MPTATSQLQLSTAPITTTDTTRTAAPLRPCSQ
jgi:hypothetical protein